MESTAAQIGAKTDETIGTTGATTAAIVASSPIDLRSKSMSQEVSVRGTGGAIFAGTLLIIGGGLWILQGLAGIIKGTSYIQNADYWITTSASTWGWIHLIGGIIAIAAGFGVFSGAAWARWLGIFIAAISIFVNFAFIPLEPWWALTIIFIDLWVIHSLFVHRRLRD